MIKLYNNKLRFIVMAIPSFNEHGLLPTGIYDCTLEELKERFGRFQRSDRRQRLYRKLADYVEALKSAKIAQELIIDGSFVTSKAEPNDIDVILVLRSDFPVTETIRPFEYNLMSARMARQKFGMDLIVTFKDTYHYQEVVTFFQQVRESPGNLKGLLRVKL